MTLYSPRICLTISSESETTSSSVTPSSAARRSPFRSAVYSATLFVCDADRVAARVEHRAVVALEDERGRGGAGVAARAAVGEEPRPHRR